MIKKLYIPIGLWGSGKTTWAKNFVKENPDTKIVSADGFRLMLNGEYEYLVELDDIIDYCMIDTANNLLDNGYNVIIDVCNLTNERRKTWLAHIRTEWRIAVIFPHKSKEWHLNNRGQCPHRFESDEKWSEMFDRQIKALEPVDENMFDEIIKIDW